VTAVTSVIVKEVCIWLWDTTKKFATAETVRAKIKVMFSKENLQVAFHLLIISFYSYLLIYTGWTDGSLSGKDVLLIIGESLALLLIVISIIIKLAKMHINTRKRE